MAFLCGEPVTAALGLVPLLLMAVERQGWRRGVVAASTIVLIGGLISLPQIVATLRILPFTLRGTGGLAPSTGMPSSSQCACSSSWCRCLSALRSRWATKATYASDSGIASVFYSLHFGVIGAWLAASALRSRRTWATLAAAGLLVALLGGVLGPAIEFLTRGTFRYPEKFLFWFALAGTPLLAGWGLERVAHGRVAKRTVLVVSAVCALGAATAAAWSPTALEWLTRGEVTAPSSAAHRAPTTWAFLSPRRRCWLCLRRGRYDAEDCSRWRRSRCSRSCSWRRSSTSEPTEFYRQNATARARSSRAARSVAMSTLDSSLGSRTARRSLSAADWPIPGRGGGGSVVA